ncbi:YhcN/YlaJ family sporulation lipoprotein [Tumebacillus sp. BK434]|uniref:YhcN/YlaJ family sporulation lipoprotein n=1 Tax=Tumebacillus sp. BK434 TaxID=2512169 RepID=UPI001052C615|nr:YhcN/YlaJ family sporulation lipoprotein [Tumebacillus sp. BK434]TCP59510.1 YhcN/YlaJ family sporulation lipoprotein [Tumebacillus sp. BK434]
MNFMKTRSLLAILTAVALVGCGNQGAAPKQQAGDHVNIKTTPAEQNPNRQQVSEIHKPNYKVRAPQIDVANNAPPKSTDQQADDIANMLTRLPGVERAAVVITGKTALVGLDLNANITGSQIDSIKFSAKEAVERSGKGYNALVSADLDTVTRSRALIRDIRNGKPIEGISNEIADIVSRLIPEM